VSRAQCCLATDPGDKVEFTIDLAASRTVGIKIIERAK
jgi:hypothetical protein